MNDIITDTNHLTTGGTTTTTATTTMSLSEQAMMIGEYDIAIVLTGLNDLKESFLPFMRSHERTKELQLLHQQQGSPSMENNNDNEEMRTPSFNDVMKGELIRILNALLDRRMHRRNAAASPPVEDGTASLHPSQHGNHQANNNNNNNDIDNIANEPLHRHHNKGPLIVFPALPYQPTVLSQYPPLSWFMIPLLDMVDANKKMLSELYPGLVLFVESPDIHDWSNATLAQNGTVWEDFCVLFKLNDIAQDANERITQLMKRHYDRWVIRDGDNCCVATSSIRDDRNTTFHSNYADVDTTSDNNVNMMNHISEASSLTDDDCLYEFDMMDNVTIRKQTPRTPPSVSLGSLMVAADGIHPSDIGYDMWGRHIADAIIKEWEKV
jgi:lysophospholipase L1-like esterase